MCRQCSPKWGDAIGYVMWRDSVGFIEAIKGLAGNQGMPYSETIPLHPIQNQPQEVDRLAWVDAAFEFIEQCEAQLWKPEGENALEYLHYRGLNDSTLREWRIGYNPTAGFGDPSEWGWTGDQKIYIPRGISIPCQDAGGLHYVKVRQRNGEPRYTNIKGGEMWPFGLGTYRNAMTALLFEGEFDALLAYQTGLGIGYASLPAGQSIRTDFAPFFESVDDVLVCYDNDERGQAEASRLVRIPGFKNAQPLPEGKDLTEYYLLGGNVFEWIYSQLEAI